MDRTDLAARARRAVKRLVAGLRTRYARWAGEAGLLVSLLAPDRLERFRDHAGRLRDLLALTDRDGVDAERHHAALERRVGELRNVLRTVPPAVETDDCGDRAAGPDGPDG